MFGKTFSQLTVVEWNFPGLGTSVANIASTMPNNVGKTLITLGGTGAVGYGTNVGAYTQSAWCNGWAAGSGLKWWEIEFSTLGLYNLDVSSKQRSSATGPRDFKVQYKIGLGAWTDLVGATAITIADNFTATTAFVNQISLPAVCNNQPSIYLRWIMTSNTSVSAGVVAAAGTSRIDELVVNCNSTGYYRTTKSGSWKDKTVWQYSADNVTWVAADTLPTYGSKTITIKTGHIVNIDTLNYFTRNCNLRIDEVVIEAGAQLNLKYSHLFINDGAGVDLQVAGTLMDSIPSSTTHYLNCTWTGACRWNMSANATFIKTLNSAASPYQTNYDLGISTIPATANWILRKTSTTINPIMTTANMYYPNFIMENVSGVAYNANTVGANFVAASPCIVKGNLFINALSALNNIAAYDSIYSNSLTIQGNTIINQNGTLVMRGDSLHLQGDLTVNGTLNYSGTLQRKIFFTGSNSQIVQNAAGTISIYNCEIRKGANDVTVNKDITIDNNLNFVSRRFFTNNTPNGLMILSALATATGASNISFVHGPCRKIGNTAFTFPIGKSNYYRQCSLGAGGVGGTTVFWSEDFNNGCNQLCLASAYVGPNGPWSVTISSPNTDCGLTVWDNIFYISCAENGNNTGLCGTGCGSDATLHVGNDPNSPSAPFFCPTGDCGAAYDAGGYCGDLGGAFGGTSTKTDIRAESPVINCTGQSSITISFRYLEQGTLTLDNATLWYYDGAVWSQLVDIPKSINCGGGQGRWTQYSIALPASANNNPNVKIGFRWVNDDSGTNAADPSFAVDSVRLSVSAPTDIFTAEYFQINPQTLTPCLNNLDPSLSAISCSEYWQIDRQQGSTARTVTLSWLSATSCAIFATNDLRVSRCDGASMWENRGNGGITGGLPAGTIVSAAGINNFSPFTIATVPTPLPITLINLEANYIGNNVQVMWQTLEEEPNSIFVIEKSQNGVDFFDILKLSAIGFPSKYSKMDYSPLNNLNYYRIKIINDAGKVTFSNIVSVTRNGESNIESIFYINDNTIGSILIGNHFIGQSAKIDIYNNMGSIVNTGFVNIDLVNSMSNINLSPGVYLFSVSFFDQHYSFRFLQK